MTKNTKLMLEALRKSPNPNTREHAIDILENRVTPFNTLGKTHEELATEGIYGGFLQAVMTGDIHESLVRADQPNTFALQLGGIAIRAVEEKE